VTHLQASDSLAHASIPVPRGMVHLGKNRLDIYLHETPHGRFRWFHADGAPTVIEGVTVEQAIEVAQLVWRDLCMQQQQQVQHL
jgi:hypothetical protein